jgi:uncharacterized protein YyaL (SSP411 family)
LTEISRNALADETSPYLLQHKDNPVHWQPWGPAALDAARAADKPILLSIGYAACHWCHVMAHESFSDPAVADLMNRHFVSIKVDREERPDLDAIYQHALALQGEQGGWPLTMFLTSEGEPFWGGTYFPPAPRWGRPSFAEVLTALANAYATQRDKIAQSTTNMRQALQRLARPAAGDGIDLALTDQVADRLVQEIDPVDGGIRGAPKFPQVGLLELFWRAWKRTGNRLMQEAVFNTLDHIGQGGIYDHLGGGFSRYSTDARWLVPHFEKMLYDNALLVELMTSVWQDTKSPLYAARIAETIGWLEREMVTAGGGFASSLDADSEHEEGKFYVWTEAEIDMRLGPRAPAFKMVYDVTEAGNWEGRTILNRLDHIELADETAEAELASCRAILLAARAGRFRPGLDDKVLADWNGLMIAALAKAASVFAEPAWLALATRAFDFVAQNFSAGADRLLHSWRDGRAQHAAVLDDYANMARAALALHAATGEARYLGQAERWVAIVDRHYWDAEGGGYFFTADDAEALIVRTKHAHDQPNPSGNGVLVEILARLYYLTGEERYRARADATVAAFAGELQRNVFGYGALLNANELLQDALQVVIIGRAADPATLAMRRAVLSVSLPNLVLAVIDPGATLPTTHPAAGKGQIGGKVTAYLCEGQACSPPVTDPEELATDLLGDSDE